MPAEIEIKLQDLVNIALGSPLLTNVNIAILQSLIEILLKKLNCENETVSLNAFDAKHLENILKTAKTSPLVFNDESVEKVSEKLDRLENLQDKVQKLDAKLERHLEETHRESNVDKTVIDWENWPSYGCDHLCTTCDPENEMACKLLHNTDFIKKLLRRMSAPIVDRIFYFEDKIEKLNEAFTTFIKRAEEEYLKIHLLEKCMAEIEHLSHITKDHRKQFIFTMEEIQDMMDSKLDKIHMPSFKKYVRDNFHEIDRSINELQNKQKCPRAAGIIMEGLRCLSCGKDKVCSDVGVQPTFMLPDMRAPKVSRRKYCRAPHDVEASRKFVFKALNLADAVEIERPEVIGKERSEESFLPKCRKPGEDFELFEGFDGTLYRKG